MSHYTHFTTNYVVIKTKMYVEDSLDNDIICDFLQLSGCAVIMCHNSVHKNKIITAIWLKAR